MVMLEPDGPYVPPLEPKTADEDSDSGEAVTTGESVTVDDLLSAFNQGGSTIVDDSEASESDEDPPPTRVLRGLKTERIEGEMDESAFTVEKNDLPTIKAPGGRFSNTTLREDGRVQLPPVYAVRLPRGWEVRRAH